MRPFLTLLVLVAALASVAAPRANAHAALVGSAPADGAVLSAAPSRFVLRFDEPVAPITLALVDGTGRATPLTAFRRDGNAIVITVPQAVGRGAHALSWRVISLDGHPVGGALVFSVGTAAPAGAMAATETPEAVLVAIWLVRLVLYLGLFVGVGGAVFRAWIANGRVPAAADGIIAGVLLAGLAAAVLSVGLQGLDAFARPLDGLADPAVWQEGAATSYGATAALAFAALLVGLCALRAAGAARLLSAMALAGIGAALAASGHASAATPQLVTRPTVFLHTAAVTWWIGALLPLALMMRGETGLYQATLGRFSRRVPWAVGVILVCGLLLAIVQIETPGAILATAYGRLFAVKLALVLALLAVAAANRWWVTPALRMRAPGAATAMRRGIVTEIVLVALILGVVAGWRFTPPPRAILAADAPVRTVLSDALGTAAVTVTPGRAGRVRVDLALATAAGAPLAAKAVTIDLADAEAGVEPIKRVAMADGGGRWHLAGVLVPNPGRWQIEVEATVDDFTMAHFHGAAALR